MNFRCLGHQEVADRKRQWDNGRGFLNVWLVGVDPLSNEGNMSVTVLSYPSDCDERMADYFVAIALIDVIEACDVKEAGFVFEIEEHDAPPTLGGWETQADRVPDDKDRLGVGEIRCFSSSEAAFGSDPGAFEGH